MAQPRSLSDADVGFGASQKKGPSQSAPSSQQGLSDADVGFGTSSSSNPDSSVTPDYANMPWSEVAQRGASNLVPSMWSAAKAIPTAIANPRETASAIGQIGSGLYSKAKGLVEDQDPDQKAKNEAVVNSLIAPYTSTAGFKKALAEDPFSVLTTASLPLSGGAGLLGKGADLLGEASLAGKAASALGTTANVASTAMDPVKLAGSAVSTVPKVVGKGVTGLQSFMTGTPQTALETAAKAGATSDPALKNAFNTFAKGQGDQVDLSQSVANAIKSIKNDSFSEWKNGKGALLGADTNPVPLDPAWQALGEARAKLTPRGMGSPPAEAAHDALDSAENMLWARSLGNPGATSLTGLDQLKQDLWEMSQGQFKGQQAESALKSVHAGVRQAISNYSPEYDSLMSGYQRMLDDVQDVTKASGSSDKTAASTQLARLVRAQKTPDGRSMIDRLAAKDPTIPYMLAGSAVHNLTAGGWAGAAEKFAPTAHLFNIGHALLSGDPSAVGVAATLPFVQGTVQSPRFWGGANYYAGAAAGNLAKPAQALGSAGQLATMPGVEAGATNLQRTQQTPYAKGGVVKSNHDRLVSRLMSLADKAKAAEKSKTRNILKLPDNTVTTALAKANAAI